MTDNDLRVSIRQAMRDARVPPVDADEAIDLAMHHVELAIGKLHMIVALASSPAIALAAQTLAISLLAARLECAAEMIRDNAGGMIRVCEIELNAGAGPGSAQ